MVPWSGAMIIGGPAPKPLTQLLTPSPPAGPWAARRRATAFGPQSGRTAMHSASASPALWPPPYQPCLRLQLPADQW